MPGNSKIGSMPQHQGLTSSDLPAEDSPRDHGSDSGNLQDHDNCSSQSTKSNWYLIALTVAIGGLQIVWCVELASVSPFLLSLGLSKSLMALVWIAGPLSGALVQPYVGIKSDDCRIAWGRRRPFMIGGALATSVSLLLLAWTREIVSSVTWIFGADGDSPATVIAQQIFATIFVYVLDFAINVIQAGIRCFIVDCAPAHQQEEANAWASRITGIGNIAGYLAGYVYLPAIFPFLGVTQFQVLCALASVALLSTLAVSCSTIAEPNPKSFGPPPDTGRAGVISFFVTLFGAVRRLPLQIKRVCEVQLFAWIGWFPFLFYITTWVGQIYANPLLARDPDLSKEEVDAIFDRGTRIGAFAMLLLAISTFATSVLVPFIITPAYAPEDAGAGLQSTSLIERALLRLRIPNLSLRLVWLFSHITFFILTWCTLFVTDTAGAITVVCAMGVPWAITNWAPFALIAGEVSYRQAKRMATSEYDSATIDPNAPARKALTDSRLDTARHDEDADAESAGERKGQSVDDQAGIVLGIHNVAIAAPQVLATLLSSVIFYFLQKPRGQPWDESVGWVLRVGGVFALGAAWWCRYVSDGPGREDEDSRGEYQSLEAGERD